MKPNCLNVGCYSVLVFSVLSGASSMGAAADPTVQNSSVLIISGGKELRVSLTSPRLVFEAGETGGALPTSLKGALGRGRRLEVTYPRQGLGSGGSLEAKLWLEWNGQEQVLRKWAEFRLVDSPKPLLVKEVVLEEVNVPGEQPRLEGTGVQSYPAFWDGFFAGIEFPVAATRVERQQVVVAHRPGWTLRNGEWHESRRAVFGVAPPGRERIQFAHYIAAHRPPPSGLHVNYNSWWTAPAPFYTEKDILGLMEEFEHKLFQPYGVAFDTFCIDMGWAEPRSAWQIKKDLFPAGFSRIRESARKMGANLGLWISPSACYHDALDPVWARTNLETFAFPLWGGQGQQVCCLGGPRYATAFRTQLVDLVKRYGIGHVKLDGYALECPETGHGHAPGALSSEAIAEGGIAAFAAVRRAQPDVWLESTCFGWNPSPWWLFHVNSVIGTFGDDAPRGRVPAPVYRESYTTARDFFNLQGAARMPVPIVAQEVLGVIHQTQDPFMNDAVITALRGHAFLPLYLNPAYLDAPRWTALAGFLQWARKNGPLMENTVPILPRSWQHGEVPRFSNSEAMPREPYGYAHWKNGRGLVALRNPWLAPQSVPLRLDQSLGMAPPAKNLQVVSIYPEPRLYDHAVQFGDTLQIPLAPYETVVLSVGSHQATRGVPKVTEVLGGKLAVGTVKTEVTRLEFEPSGAALGPDWTSSMPGGLSALQLELEAGVTVTAPKAELLLLTEAGRPLSEPVDATLTVDGRRLELTSSSSAAGWSATGQPAPEHWLFLKAPLTRGQHQVSLKVLGEDSECEFSVWLWAIKPGGAPASYPNSLPAPETISLDAQPLVPPMNPQAQPRTVHCERTREKIDGIFLDALEPASCLQGWGKLQRNRSVWDKPMTIAGRRFRRGLGTHAESRITYDLGGRYRRFQSWVGADGASRATVTFEVWADGRKLWESGLMKTQSPAKFLDLDITSVVRLELVVGNGGDGIQSDHADWCDAKVLR